MAVYYLKWPSLDLSCFIPVNSSLNCDEGDASPSGFPDNFEKLVISVPSSVSVRDEEGQRLTDEAPVRGGAACGSSAQNTHLISPLRSALVTQFL